MIFSDTRGENHTLRHFLTVLEKNKKMSNPRPSGLATWAKAKRTSKP